jgi:pilus assembly protein FimV
MSNGKNPLMLMMALSMPGAANALGLGDIHVDSGLNERLTAEIDIVGATESDLSDLRAAVANRETFLHYGADRPGFLSSATFKVTQNRQGRPVLAVRSTEAFTEPLVNFLVDVHWRYGELVRQYTLLLDPPGFATPIRKAEATGASAASVPAPAAPDVPAAPPAAAPLVETQIQTTARQVDLPGDPPDIGSQRDARKTTHIKVGAKATLRGIAWRVGERSPSDLQRMMIAIFRANPSAFAGNINRLHLGAVLTIPSYAEVAAISKADAKREFHAQMSAWLSPARALHAGATAAAANAPVANAPVANAPAAAGEAAGAGDPVASKASESADLSRRIQSLEHELSEVQGLLESQNDKLAGMKKSLRADAPGVDTPSAEMPSADAPSADAPSAASPSPDSGAVQAAAPLASVNSSHLPLVPLLGGTGLLAAALTALYMRLRPSRKPDDSRIDAQPRMPLAPTEAARADVVDAQPETVVRNDAHKGSSVHTAKDDDGDTQETAAPIFDEDTHPLLPVVAANPTPKSANLMPKRVNNAAATISRPEPEGTTVNLRVETVNLPVNGAGIELTRVDATRLDYNLVDLDMTAQHVQMPSVLNEQVVAKERRTNLADALQLAIEREPDRHDLRMKLLELYYSAAATNRKAFLEVVQKFANDRDYLQAEQWDKIAFMGRQIASDNPLFDEEPAADDDLANCA